MANKKPKQPYLRYCICLACDHRWTDRTPEDAAEAYTGPCPMGDLHYHPPRVSCPCCGKHYSIRSFVDTYLKPADDAGVFYLDPFTGEELAEELIYARMDSGQ